MIAPIDKLKSLLSNDIVSLFGDDAINDVYIHTFKYVLSLMTDESVIQALAQTSLTSINLYTPHASDTDTDVTYSKINFTKDRRILKVERKHTNGASVDNVFYECRKVDTLLGKSGKLVNNHSIHFSNDKWDPVYYVDEVGGIEIKPKNTVGIGEGTPYPPQGRVWWITYPNFEIRDTGDFEYTFSLNGKTFSAISKAEEDTILYGIPLEAKELFYTQLALNLCQLFLSDFVHEEEDTELVGLIKEQAGILTTKRAEELAHIQPKYGKKEVKR